MEESWIKIFLRNNRESFRDFVVLYEALEKYATKDDKQAQLDLMNIIHILSDRFPLPSGRYGNALAVALEMQMYKGALFMIENKDALNINLDVVAYNTSKKEVLDVNDIFELSQIDFSLNNISEDNDRYKKLSDDWKKKIIKRNNANAEAFYKIETLLKTKNKAK